jgi:hypothetical protein
MAPEPPSRREIFNATVSGAIERPPLPPLHADGKHMSTRTIPHSLDDYKVQEGSQQREARFRNLWQQLPQLHSQTILPASTKLQIPVLANMDISAREAEELRHLYVQELLHICESSGGSSSHHVDWETFRAYIVQKEEELWDIFHSELDLDGNGHLDSTELQHALLTAGKPQTTGLSLFQFLMQCLKAFTSVHQRWRALCPSCLTHRIPTPSASLNFGIFFFCYQDVLVPGKYTNFMKSSVILATMEEALHESIWKVRTFIKIYPKRK